jgi:hypothetical protein
MFKTPWAETYPGLLRTHGFYTGHIGKWHNGKFPADNFDFGRSYAGVHWIKNADGTQIHVTQKNENDARVLSLTRFHMRLRCISSSAASVAATMHAADQNRPVPASVSFPKSRALSCLLVGRSSSLETVKRHRVQVQVESGVVLIKFRSPHRGAGGERRGVS